MPINRTPDLNFNSEEIEALYQIIREYQEDLSNEEEYWDYDEFEEKIDKTSVIKKLIFFVLMILGTILIASS